MSNAITIKDLVRLLKTKDQKKNVQFLVLDEEAQVVCCATQGATHSLEGVSSSFSVEDKHTQSPAPRGKDSVHPDDQAVDRFAAAMKATLAQKRENGQGGRENNAEYTEEHLSRLLIDRASKGDPIEVANLAMMLHHRQEQIATLPSAQPLSVKTSVTGKHVAFSIVFSVSCVISTAFLIAMK